MVQHAVRHANNLHAPGVFVNFHLNHAKSETFVQMNQHKTNRWKIDKMTRIARNYLVNSTYISKFNLKNPFKRHKDIITEIMMPSRMLLA